MNEIRLKSWAEFEEISLDGLRSRIRTGKISYHKQTIFRGQPNADWNLETTLERIGKRRHSCAKYDSTMRSAASTIKTVTDKNWEFEPLLQEDDILTVPRNLEPMSFLRQNSFPSPLLDWSQSPYIASYFAFKDADPNNSDHVAIYSYTEAPSGSRDICTSEPTILCIGPWMPSDKKHFLQQSRYTVCRMEIRGSLHYVSHRDAFAREDPDQNVQIKFLIPAEEKPKVLRRLRVMNITPYSLFETTETLLEVIATDVFGL